MRLTKGSYFLVHNETGQRYPIKAPVIIGRANGDIVFSRDMKLSTQHCEVTPAKRGLMVRDLNSANGTTIDGTLIDTDRSHLLRPDGELAMGEQAFTLRSVSVARKVRRRKSKNSGNDGYGLVYVILLAAILLFAWYNRGLDHSSQIQLSHRQLGETFETYQELQLSLDRQSAPPYEIAIRIQGQVLSRLSALTRRWAEYQPQDGERQMFGAQLHFASALAGHAKTEILYINSGDMKYVDELDQWTAQVEQAATDLRMVTVNMNPPFPALLQSPLQQVEREMRQTMRDYKKLGNSVQNKEVSEKQMGVKIREDLMPKLMSVYSKMGAIVPQNEFEQRKVVLEQKLMTAFIGQVKAMSLFTESKDQKYGKELEHWTSTLEKLNAELKQTLNPARLPAGRDGPRGI